MKPFFSIIIPAYNCEHTLRETLNSVIAQTYTDYEVLILNDYSTDSTQLIIDEFVNKYDNLSSFPNNQNLGVARTRNRGIALATGTFIAFLDSDDLWHKDKLKLQAEIIEVSNCDLCCTSYDFIDLKGQSIKAPYIVPSTITYHSLLKENLVGCSSLVVKSTSLERHKFNPNFYHEDYSLWLTLLREGAKLTGIPDVLMHYRILETSRSFNKKNAALQRFLIYKNQEKLGFFRSCWYFFLYATNGIKKSWL